MHSIKQQFINILKHRTISIGRKTRLLSHILREVESSSQLLAILVIANSQRWSSSKLTALRNSLTITDGELVPDDVGTVIKKVLNEETLDGIISSSTFEVITFLLSPLSFGLTSLAVNNLTNPYLMTVDEAFTELGLYLEGTVKETKKVQSCGICDRLMKSINSSGVCSSCLLLASKFPNFRRGVFYVPLTSWNFPKLKGNNETEVLFKTFDYVVTKKDGSLVYTPDDEFVGYLDVPLPIEEFAHKIHTM